MKGYGKQPENLGIFQVQVKEMMFYQYLPIKMSGNVMIVHEQRLDCFNDLIGKCSCDFVGSFGLDSFVQSYVYLTAKYMYKPKGQSFNRFGRHCDGFMTQDINYVWCDAFPTIYNFSEFDLDQDDSISLQQMEDQAQFKHDWTYPVNTLLRLDQFVVHEVNSYGEGMRAFFKLSFSKDRYDLEGNAHNYLLEYNWEMKPRKNERNIPQSQLKPTL